MHCGRQEAGVWKTRETARERKPKVVSSGCRKILPVRISSLDWWDWVCFIMVTVSACVLIGCIRWQNLCLFLHPRLSLVMVAQKLVQECGSHVNHHSSASPVFHTRASSSPLTYCCCVKQITYIRLVGFYVLVHSVTYRWQYGIVHSLPLLVISISISIQSAAWGRFKTHICVHLHRREIT